MKNLLTVIAVCFLQITFAQLDHKWSEKFDFDTDNEQDVKFILTDNYNHYLFSASNSYGLVGNNSVKIRKFDQTSQLLDTYTYDFPKIDNNTGTLHNYLGSFELDANRFVFVTESYFGKSKKKEVHYHLFDKTTSQFATTLIGSYPIESNMKSGTTVFAVSENKGYFGVSYQQHSVKKEPNTNYITVIDSKSLNVAWKKEATFSDNYYERAFTVTNSGKAILLRGANGFKLHNYLVEVSSQEQRKLELSEEIQLHNPKAISIGEEEYLIDFNHKTKGVRAGDYDQFLLYDLKKGAIVKNNPIKIYNSVKNVKEVVFRKINIQNDEIHIFTECKYQSGTVAKKTNPMSTTAFNEPLYGYGYGHLIVLSFNGEIKQVKTLTTPQNTQSRPELFHSYGLLNIQGNYCIKIDSGVSKINLDKNDEVIYTQRNISKDPYIYETNFVNQLSFYNSDSKRLIIALVKDNKMSLISIFNFPDKN